MEETREIEIIYSNENFTVVNKPCGMLVHRTPIAEDDAPAALQLLRLQLRKMVYPVHRIDRPTSGLLLFAHSPEWAKLLQKALQSDTSIKTYTAIVRGWILEEVQCNREVKNDRGNLKSASTLISPIKHFELPFATDRYSTARYTMVEAQLSTGRWHQIRQHLAQMRHYIINDRVHGDGKQNRLMNEQLNLNNIFLHATKLEFTHPTSNVLMTFEASFPSHWDIFLGESHSVVSD